MLGRVYPETFDWEMNMTEAPERIWIGFDGREYHPTFATKEDAEKHGWFDESVPGSAHEYVRADLPAAVTVKQPDWEGFGRALMEDWPTGDIDGSHLFDMSLKYGLISEVPGGYNPDEHIDAEGICPEAGDPWYEYTFGHKPDSTDPMQELADLGQEYDATTQPAPVKDALQEAVTLIDELCESFDCAAEGIGGQRYPITILQEIGPKIAGWKKAALTTQPDPVKDAARVERALRHLVKEADACGRNINAAWRPLFDEARAALRALAEQEQNDE